MAFLWALMEALHHRKPPRACMMLLRHRGLRAFMATLHHWQPLRACMVLLRHREPPQAFNMLLQAHRVWIQLQVLMLAGIHSFGLNLLQNFNIIN